MADETQDLAEVRLEKLRQIEALGIDPWGQRFDDTMPIGDDPPAARPSRSTTTSRGRRSAPRAASCAIAPAGKVLFLEIWDQTGRVQVMIRVNKVGETDGRSRNCSTSATSSASRATFGKTQDRRADDLADEPDVPGEVAGAAPEGRGRDAATWSSGCGTAIST